MVGKSTRALVFSESARLPVPSRPRAGRSCGTSAPAVDWTAVWSAVAMQLREDKFAPKFLTEDGVRLATLRALDEQIDVVRYAEIEYGSVHVGGEQLGRIDLVVQLVPKAMVVEFKYPREPRQKLPPWPDHLGGVLSDTYRLGMLANGEPVGCSIQVLVSGEGFLGYFRRTVMRLGLARCKLGEATPCSLQLTPARTSGLAATTRGRLKGLERLWEINADRVTELEITGKGLWLAAYSVTARPACLENC